MTMIESWAAIAWEAGAPLSIETIEIEGPRTGEVLVEIMAIGVCHTDAQPTRRRNPGAECLMFQCT
jgi:S-(hydroxymethyl)glutathione dehydrogenase/alcohol dehydrogenase